MTDPIDPKPAPGTAAFWDGYTTANRSLHIFATEMQKASKTSIDAATTLMDQLHGAQSPDEIVALQTGFLRESFTHYADVARRFSELMLAAPMEFAKHGLAAVAPHEASGAVQPAQQNDARPRVVKVSKTKRHKAKGSKPKGSKAKAKAM